MKTLIELYVNEQFDNLAAARAFRPERVVFLSGGFMPDKVTREGMTRFIKTQCGTPEKPPVVRFIDIGNRSLGSLFKKIREVVKEYEDCAVDMTGGPTGALISAHSYCMRSKTKAFFYDGRRRRYINIHGMGEEINALELKSFTVEGIISMGGGLVTGTGHSIESYPRNKEVVRKVLDVYASNLSLWNAFSEYLQFACKHYYDAKTNLLIAPTTLLNNSILLYASKKLLGLLREAGALTELKIEGDALMLRFANGFMKELLTTVGMCLELYVYVAAQESGHFDDCRMSVEFDWDGIFHGNFNDTTNELDVVMTRGLSATFVSCKSARPDTRDLYEILYLASRFGGRSAGVALATAVDLSGDAWSIYMRARDMGVTVIERSDIEKGMEHVANKLVEPSWLDEKPVKQNKAN